MAETATVVGALGAAGSTSTTTIGRGVGEGVGEEVLSPAALAAQSPRAAFAERHRIAISAPIVMPKTTVATSRTLGLRARTGVSRTASRATGVNDPGRVSIVERTIRIQSSSHPPSPWNPTILAASATSVILAATEVSGKSKGFRAP
jgi:hypothetical protein